MGHKQLKTPTKAEQAPFRRSCIVVGAQVLNRSQQAGDVEWFKNSMTDHGAKFQLLLDRHLEKLVAKLHTDLDPENKKGSMLPLVEAVRAVKKELDSRIDKTAQEFEKNQKSLDEALVGTFDLDSKTSAMSQFQHAVTDTLKRFERMVDPNQRGTLLGDFGQKLDRLLEERLGMHDRSTLGAFKKELTEALVELRGEVRTVLAAQEITQSIKAKLPGKGVTFEAEAFEVAVALAQARNDVAEAVGTTPGKGSTSKKGDIVYRDGITGARIVLECKNYESAISPAKIADAVGGATENREADFAIFVVKDRTCLPESFGKFHVSEQFIACTIDLLDVALKIALIKLQSERLRADDQKIDYGAVVRSVQAALRDVDTLDGLSATCATAERGIGKVRDGLEAVRDSIRHNLGTAEAVLAGASPTAVPHSAGPATTLN